MELPAASHIIGYDLSMPTRTPAQSRVLFLIAAFKLLKGLVLFAVGIGALRVLSQGAATEVNRWANAFRVDPGNRYFHLLLTRFANLNEKSLKELSVGTFFYSAILLAEGVGLMLRKRWAEYFTIIATGSFIPLEIYELFRRASFARGIVLALNVAVVAYLVTNLRRTH